LVRMVDFLFIVTYRKDTEKAGCWRICRNSQTGIARIA
jgi:hypothetical protein